MSDTSRTPRLQSVDVLRALAALWVVLHHLPHRAVDLPELLRVLAFLPVTFGYLGVILFLVLSGFCIHLGVTKRMARGQEARADWFRFWRRRFWRLYPPYLAAIAVSLGVYYALGPSAYEPGQRVTHLGADLLTHLLLVQNLFQDYHQGLGNGVFWTLALEEQLYLLFAAYLLLRRHGPARRALLVVFGISALWRCGCGWLLGLNEWSEALPRLGPEPFALGRWMHWPLTFWFAWVLGAVAAEAHAGALTLPAWCRRRRLIAACAAAGLVLNSRVLERLPGGNSALLGAVAGLSDLAFALAAFALLCRWVRAEEQGRFGGRLVGLLAAVGVMSYSLYLTHLPVIHALEHALAPGETFASFFVRVAVYVPVCLGGAALFFFLVERHFLLPPGRQVRADRSVAASLELAGERARDGESGQPVRGICPGVAGRCASKIGVDIEKPRRHKAAPLPSGDHVARAGPIHAGRLSARGAGPPGSSHP